MPKRSSTKNPTNINQLVKWITEQATSENQEILTEENLTPEQMAARILGRKGGLKGGRARAKSLSAIKRKQIAKKAALARWRGNKSKP
jgi:hypothetical protein